MTENVQAVDAALADAARRTAQLLRSGLDPAAQVPGLNWTAAETAAHLVADLREHTAILLTENHHASGTVGGRNAAERGAAANRAQLDAFPERDLTVLAGLIEEAAAAFSAAIAAQPSRGAIVTANGVPMGPGTLVSVLLGEQLIHGLDLARSARRTWPIARGDALRVIPGIMAVAGDYLDRDAAHDLHVCYELHFGPGDRYRVRRRRPHRHREPGRKHTQPCRLRHHRGPGRLLARRLWTSRPVEPDPARETARRRPPPLARAAVLFPPHQSLIGELYGDNAIACQSG